AGVRMGLPLSGADGQPLGWLWSPYQPSIHYGFARSPPILEDLDGDGLADVVISHATDDVLGSAGGDPYVAGPIHALSGPTGETLSTSNVTIQAAYLMSGEVDGDSDTVDVVLDWWGGRAAIGIDPTGGIFTHWANPGPPTAPGRPMLVDIDGDGTEDLVDYDTAAGLIYATRTADGEPLWPGGGVATDGVRRIAGGEIYRELLDGGFEPMGGGDVQQGLPYTQLRRGAIAVANLTGQGHPSLVFGSYEGLLFCLDLSDGSLDWTYDMGTEIGSIVAADTTGDGLVELLVTAGDGRLYAIGQATDLGLIPAVVDGLTEDLDLVPKGTPGFDVDTFTVSWSPPEGGGETTTGYLLRLAMDTGAVVADWEDVGDVSSATRTLTAPLVAEQIYQAVVLPYGPTGAGTVATSDGFRLDPAWFEATVVEESPDGESTDGDGVTEDAPEPDIGPTLDTEVGPAPDTGSAPDSSDVAADTSPAPSEASGCGDCSGGGPSPVDAALWGLLVAWMLRRSRRATR
ncbi:MAG: hypothetical protein QF464_10375, partial [Myxococcota bacterium]|nr:hypothetical protein [Myxococcota bacterium]